MNGVYTPCLSHDFVTGGSLQKTSQVLNLVANGLLIDVDFKPEDGKTASVEVLKDILVSLNLRFPSSPSILLLDSCRLYDLLAFSDFVGGVSMESLDFVVSTANRISGYIDFGCFKVPEGGALDFSISGVAPSWGTLSIRTNYIYAGVSNQRLYGFSSVVGSGGEQSYTNVLNMFVLGNSDSLAEITYRDVLTSGSTVIRDGVAFANSIGRFEFFTDFGLVYSDSFGTSQNLTVKAPLQIGGNSVNLFVKQEYFRPELGDSLVFDFESDYNRLLSSFKNDTLKYDSVMNR